jgi:Autoinducer binding domain
MPLQFGPLKIAGRGHSPAAVQPLILAAETGGDLAPVVQAITRSFGFEVFAHGVMLSLRLEAESQIYMFSTHTPSWLQIYDQRAYVEVDPRVHGDPRNVVARNLGSGDISRKIERNGPIS